MILTLVAVAISVIILLIAEKQNTSNVDKTNALLKKLPAIAKIVASCLFIFFFYSYSPTVIEASLTPFYYWILAALGLSLLGDILLIPKSRSSYFLAGIAAFALAHIAYWLAFLQLPVNFTYIAISGVIYMGAGFVIYQWLTPYLTKHYRIMVPAYLAIILVMVILGSSIGMANQQYWLAAGSLLFAISDIFVARNRFVKPGFINRLIGLPLYYVAQIMIAYGAIEVISNI